MKIERYRYIVTRNNNTEVFCGSSKNHSFEKINELKDKKIAIQTYATRQLAESNFKKSWWNIDFEYEIIKVLEVIRESDTNESKTKSNKVY